MAANRDEILLQRLQATIDSWNSEVTAAHEGLARQIGDARQQLGTLIDTLGRRAKSTNGNGNGTEALRSRALQERDTALLQLTERNRELEDTLHQIQEERRTLHQELEVALADVQDLRGQIAAHQEQEANSARIIEKAEREVASLRRSVESAAAGRVSIDENIARLNRELDAARSDRAAIAAHRDSVVAELKQRTADAEQYRLEVESLTAIVERLESESADLKHARDERAEELAAELTAAERMLRDQQEQLATLTDDRTRLSEQVAMLQTEIEAVAARADRHEAAGREALDELEALRASRDALAQAESELRASRDELAQAEASLREELESARAAADSLRHAERELRDELTSLNHQYERQRAKLAETEQELEAHWNLAKQANQRDEAHRQEIAALRKELEQAGGAVAQLKRQATAAAEEAKSGSWQLESRLTELTKENGELRRLLDAAEQREPAPAPAKDEELDRVREELLQFEQLLVEREEAVEAAAARMQKLEETALRVQAEVASLRANKPAPAPSASLEEIERMRGQLKRLETANAEQAARIVEQDVEIAQRRDEVAALQQKMAELEAAPAPQPDADDEVPRLVPSAAFPAHDDAGQKKSMGEILVHAGIITANQLASALDEQRTAKKRRLGSILVEKGLIREEIVAQVVSSQLKLPFVRLSETKIHRSAVALLDGRLATHHMCFPIAATTEQVVVAMANPLDVIAIEDLEFATHLKVTPVVATLSDITSAIVEYYGVTIANTLAEDTFDVQTPPRAPLQQRPLQ